MADGMRIEGLEDLEKNLERLSKSAGKGVLRRSLRKAAEPMADIMRSKAPKKTGALAQSIAISSKLNKRQSGIHRKMFKDDRQAVELFLGPAYGPGKGNHGHLLEFGTKPHFNKGLFAGSRHPGTAPQPFVRPAWDQDRADMLDRLSKILWEELDKSMARAERKAAKEASE